MEHQKDSLENKCLYKVQAEQRISRGNLDYNKNCDRCNGYDLYCDNYVKLKWIIIYGAKNA